MKLERITSVRSDWSVETQSSAMFARPSLPSARGFTARLLDRPGGEGLAARLACAQTPTHKRRGSREGTQSGILGLAESADTKYKVQRW